MKTICIVDDHRPLWAEIEGLLADVNAQCYFIDEDSASALIKDDRPDLIILGPASFEKISGNIPPVKVLVVDDLGAWGGKRASRQNNVTVAGWPIQGDSLLSLTSELLAVAERRFFKALMRIYPEGDKPTFHMGESEDFSLTGLSFTASEAFSVGQQMDISFFVPSVRRHLRVNVEIMRRFPHQSENLSVYGCRFLNLDKEENSLIVNFVLGPPR